MNLNDLFVSKEEIRQLSARIDYISDVLENELSVRLDDFKTAHGKTDPYANVLEFAKNDSALDKAYDAISSAIDYLSSNEIQF